MTLRWRLTLLYTALTTLLLSVVVVATTMLMNRNLVGNLDSALRDTHRQFESTVSQLALDSPQTILERDPEGVLPRARYQFPNDAIQIEDLSLYNHDLLLSGLAPSQPEQSRSALLQNVRTVQDATRQVVTGLSASRPILLTDGELQDLIASPTGRIILNKDIQSAYGKSAQPYRVLVTLNPLRLHAPNTDPFGSQQPSYVLTYVGRSLSGVTDTILALQQVLLVLLFFGVGLSSWAAYLLAGQALRPLRQVRQAAERIGGQNLTERVPVPPTHDEVAALAGSLNAMLGRLEDSFEAQRRFTSDASHELRTPVTAISGHAGYLLRRTSPTPQQAESLRIIQTESERLTNLIASLLQLARSDSGVLSLTLGPVLSGHLLQEVARELEPLASAQHTQLAVEGPDVAFEGDHDRLKQVIINLVGNALKAGASEVKLISRPQAETQEVRLSVQDNGPGIAPEHLEKLFDRFYRVQDSRSRDQGGAGLGLSIARGIVEAHKGRIWFESEVGQGTTVHVQLPLGDLPALDDDDIA